MNNDARIRQIVQQEMARNAQGNRFNLNITGRHQHTRNDVAPISGNDITPGNSVAGSVAFTQQTTYNIGVNFNPTSVVLFGNVIGSGSEKFFTFGSARFGPSLYLQPNTSTSVKPGGTPQTIVQCSSYFGNDGSAFHTLADEEHVVDVEYPLGTIHARATITNYSNQGIILTVDNLDSGWSMNLSFIIS